MTKKKKAPGSLKLRNLKIKNFKAFDSFEIEFPVPRMKDDPDIFAIGSKNGLGKTSILESCSLLYLAASMGDIDFFLRPFRDISIDLFDLLIRAGKEQSNIQGSFEHGKSLYSVSLSLYRNGKVVVKGDVEKLRKIHRLTSPSLMEMSERFLFSLAGLNSEPLITPGLMYFHSYRKVREGNPELGMMVEGSAKYRRSRFRPGFEFPMSSFKLEILRSMMSRASLFEDFNDVAEAEEEFQKLDELTQTYAGGRIEKLRPMLDNTVDFRISPMSGGESFTFDGLSSGQKEIISTLFLIWRYSRSYPGIILIDEPELHLNAEWHRDFVRMVTKLAPHNQYIISTHSEDIFSSVPKNRRVLLESSR